MHSEADSLLYLGMKQPLNLTSGSITEPPNSGWSLEPSTNLTLDHNGKLNSQILMQALIWEGEVVIGVWLGEGLDIGRERSVPVALSLRTNLPLLQSRLTEVKWAIVGLKMVQAVVKSALESMTNSYFGTFQVSERHYCSSCQSFLIPTLN